MFPQSLCREQIRAINRAKLELDAAGNHQTLSLSRVTFLSHNDADRKRKIQLAPYAEAGVDRFIMNFNFGVEQAQVLESIQCFAEEVMPHFVADPAPRARAS